MIKIPHKIKVGYDKREDTYTGKLAYVIYYDGNNLRKESSWDKWRDKELGSDDYENLPLDGFVINKHAGGYNYNGWNRRNTYIRVYDPRGFEIEISVENLVYILEFTSSIQGKGLSGKFIYGWDGVGLVLLPENSTEYVLAMERRNIIDTKSWIQPSELILGGTYRNMKSDELIYMGKYDTYSTMYISNGHYSNSKNEKQKFVFYNVTSSKFEYYSSIYKKLSSCLNEIPSTNYSTLYDSLKLEYTIDPIDTSNNKYVELTEDEMRNPKLQCVYINRKRYMLAENYMYFYSIYDSHGFNTKLTDMIYDTKYYGYYGRIDFKNMSLSEVIAQYKPCKQVQYRISGIEITK